jgi:hypothetical protein
MPAIQPVRLKKQVSELVAKFNQPTLFIRELHALLDLYTDHTQRPGQAGEPSPLLDSYNTPTPVMRQVWHELSLMIKIHPADVLPLCDALWAESNYDLQLLATRLLGMLPVDPPDPVLDRVQSWVHSDLEKRLLDGLLEYGLIRLQQDNPDKLLGIVSSWLSSSDLPVQQAGLRCLLPIIKDQGMEYLPAIFRLLTPFFRVAPSYLRPDILATLTALVHYSPNETAYLLRQNLSTPDNPDTPWLIRQVLSEFPEDTQLGLRAALKGER